MIPLEQQLTVSKHQLTISEQQLTVSKNSGAIPIKNLIQPD